MPTDSDNYHNGLSGFGAPKYGSAAWRAGDAERQRREQARRASERAGMPSAGQSAEPRMYPPRDGDDEGDTFVLILVLAFTVAGVVGFFAGLDALPHDWQHAVGKVIGPEGWISRFWFGAILGVFLFFLGVVLEKFLRMVFNLALLAAFFMGIIWGVSALFQ